MIIKEFIWFSHKSWFYLGCNSGTGRWRARKEFLKGIIPAFRHYMKLKKQFAP